MPFSAITGATAKRRFEALTEGGENRIGSIHFRRRVREIERGNGPNLVIESGNQAVHPSLAAKLADTLRVMAA